MLGDLAEASIVHIAPSDPMTSNAGVSAHAQPSYPLMPHNEKDLASNPACWEARINITTN